MRKLKNMKQKILAVLMSVMCLAMIAPSGIPAFAAPAEEDPYALTSTDCDGGTVTFDSAKRDAAALDEGIATFNEGSTTLNSGQVIKSIPDDADHPYPSTLNLFKLTPYDENGDLSDAFSYKINDDMGVDYDYLTPAGSAAGTATDSIAFTTKIDSHDEFSRTNDPITVMEKNVCQIGDRSVDMTLTVKRIDIGEYQYKYWGDYNVGDTMWIGGIYAREGAGYDSQIGTFHFTTDYGGSVDFEWEINMTYSGTDETVDVPFELIVSDIDMNGEAWTLNDADYSAYELYEDNVLDITSPSDGQTRFSIQDYDLGNGNTDKEEYAYTGLTALTYNGKFSGTTSNPGGLTGSFMSFWCDYVIDPVPEKTIENDKGAYNAGETITFPISYPMPEYMVDTYRTYESIVINDYIPTGLTYVDSSARVYSDGEDITDSAGNLSYVVTDEDPETSGVLTYTFDKEWLDNKENYRGQEIKMTLDCTVDEGHNGETIVNPGDVEFDRVAYPVEAPPVLVTDPTLAITKTADKTAYSVSDTVTYTIAVNQTYQGAVAQNTVVTDTVPSELALVDVVTDMGTATMDGNSFAVNVGDLWDTDTATITVTATALEAADDIKNTAYASADYVPEVSDNAILSVRKPGLTIRKEADQEQYYPGETVTYTIRVQNMLEEDAADVYDGDTDDEDASGDASPASRIPTAYNVVVSDSLPDGLTLVSVLDDADGEIAIDGNSFTVSYPYMYYGEEYVLTVEATVDDDVGNTTLTNVATVLSDHTDPVSDDADIHVTKPNLSIEKTADKDSCDSGDTVTFTVTVDETTEGVAETNVVVTDPLPSGFTLSGTPRLSGVEGSVAADDNAVTVTIPCISYGESAVITVQATVDDGYEGETITNTAYVHGDHTDEINDDATVSVNAPSVATPESTTPESTTPESTTPVKTGQAIGGVVACIAAVIAISVLIVVVSRRRRIRS